MSVSISARRRGRRRTPPGLCDRCRGRVKWLRLDGVKWRFALDPVAREDHASPPAYPVWRGRAWRPGALLEYLTDHFDLDEETALQIVAETPWHALHTCDRNRGGDDR